MRMKVKLLNSGGKEEGLKYHKLCNTDVNWTVLYSWPGPYLFIEVSFCPY